ncbi:PepSY-associated TM helix domain-containing protein [Draconibacterium sediminis]|uniref:PepSY-associated TM helix domain-containing protein n=1 Tax=Draconibacterium sediminis TaxID=1544798 RepID=UPI0005D44EFF|nr:PepSY-associated TM helix domain-containing protein [Draconibacterium sediminis]
MKRNIIFAKKIHLWLGLVCGFVATLSGLSGSLYVWQPELSQVLNPGVLCVERVDTLSEETIHKTAVELYLHFEGELASLHLPYREQQSFLLVLKNGEYQYFHPATGDLLGTKTISIRFFEHLLRFHRTLLIPRYGNYIVGGSTILFFLLLLTSGFYLWWKRYRRNPRKGFSLLKNVSLGIIHYDFHKLLGILFLIPLFVAALSGSFFIFMPAWKSVLHILDSPGKQHLETEGSDYRSFEDALQCSSEDGYKLRTAYFPTEMSDAHRLRYIKKRFISAGLRQTKEVQLNQNLRSITFAEYHQNPLSEKIVIQAYPIHIGEMFGLLGRILVFITGFIPAILLITGYRFYKFRKSNNKYGLYNKTNFT